MSDNTNSTNSTSAINQDYLLDEAILSSWCLTAASFVLITGQVGYTIFELSQTHKKNKEFIVHKNLLVLLTSMFVWFCFGYSIAYGTDPTSVNIQFGGFNHGWFGDLSGGLEKEYQVTTDDEGVETTNFDVVTNQENIDKTFLFNQRRFFTAFGFSMLASNIATSSVSERIKMSSIIYFVIVQHILITPVVLCWAYARPLVTDGNYGGVGFLYNFGFFDRAGAIPILYAGALCAMVSCSVVGPRYGVFMPVADQQKISGGGK